MNLIVVLPQTLPEEAAGSILSPTFLFYSKVSLKTLTYTSIKSRMGRFS